MQTRNTDYIYKNDLDKPCFQHDMDYGKYKDLNKRKKWDKVLRYEAYEIASNPKYDGCQRGLPSMLLKFFGKKSKDIGVTRLANKSAIKSMPN